jgi:hypothetical protein
MQVYRQHGTNGSGLLDWNDARIFLAVARHGSLRAVSTPERRCIGGPE